MPISPLWAKEEVAFVVNNAEFKVFVVSFPLMAAVEDAKHEFEFPTKIIVVGGKPEDSGSQGQCVSFGKEMATACDQFANVKTGTPTTSGSSCSPPAPPASPRAASTSSKRCWSSPIWSTSTSTRWPPVDVLGGSAPVTFAAGYGTFCLIPFAGGGTISLLPKFTPDDMMSTIVRSTRSR